MVPKPPESMHAVLASRDELMRFHDPERIQGYCRTCEKHGQYWSCPPFAAQPLAGFPDWSHAIIVCRRTMVTPGSTREQLLDRFQTARVDFGDRLRKMEAAVPGSTALVAGHCSGCPTCTRPDARPCRWPERMRYSLEAVGFDVTGLAEGLAGQKLDWPRNGAMPAHLTTIGAVLCPNADTAHWLHAAVAS
jgi:hypothetical protein